MAEGELSDEGLLAGMAVGEQAAAVTFVRRYQKRVFGLAYSMVGDAGVAEDVAQEAMIRVWRHAPVFDPRRGSVASWVLTITRNLAIDALRLRRAVPTDPDDFAAAAVLSNEHNPEDAAHRGDVRSFVRTALTALPTEQRRAVERDLVAEYHQRLVSAGVEGFDFDSAWAAYREGAMYGVFLFVGMAGQVEDSERAVAVITDQIRRYADMAIDLEAPQAAGLL